MRAAIPTINTAIFSLVSLLAIGCGRVNLAVDGLGQPILEGAPNISESYASPTEALNRRLLRSVMDRVVPQPVAHRGVTRLVNENSLESIVLARRAGVDAVELDVRRLQDDKFVIFHDRKVRELNAKAPDYLLGRSISDLRSEDIRQIKVPRVPNSAPPLLRDALLVASANKVVAFLDLKGESTAIVGAVIERILALNAEDVVIIQSQHPEVTRFIRRNYPEIPVLVRAFSKDDVLTAISLQPAVVQVDLDWATPEMISSLTARGIPALAKTLLPAIPDDKESWCHAWRLGISLILTDRADDLAQSFGSIERAKSLCPS